LILEPKLHVPIQKTYGILVLYSNTFDASLFLPPKSEREIGSRFDMAKVNLPKIFRRQVQYEASKAAGITDQTSLRNYLETQTHRQDLEA
jgi:hypothetical protein